MRRVGFTTIELIIVVVMIGIIAVIGFPKIRRALDTTNVRSSRVYLSTAVATARAAAKQLGVSLRTLFYKIDRYQLE